MMSYPTLLDHPAPHIRAYQRETVIAEKLHAMITLGMANSRMKDFYDLFMLARDFAYDGDLLAQAIRATFEKRGTAIPQATPVSLTEDFVRDHVKSVQWKAFVRKLGPDHGIPDFPGIVSQLHPFLVPAMKAATEDSPCPQVWSPGGPWIPISSK